MFFPILGQQAFDHSISKVVCVGRNYADHAKELNNPIPSQPLLFIKPDTCAVDMQEDIVIPTEQGSVHHELEIALLIGEKITNASSEQAQRAIVGIGLGLDLTLRDVQDKLKQKGQPWERAKAFDGACPLSQFIPVAEFPDFSDIDLTLWRNGQLQQQGNSKNMLFAMVDLVVEISQNFTLKAGDVVLTGTPAGVGPLIHGDQLKAQLSTQGEEKLVVESQVV